MVMHQVMNKKLKQYNKHGERGKKEMHTESWYVQEPSELSSSVNVALHPIRWHRSLIPFSSAILRFGDGDAASFFFSFFPLFYNSVSGFFYF